MDYKAIHDNSADGITIFDRDGNLVWCNDVALEIYGFSSKDEVIGTNFTNFVHPKCASISLEQIERAKTHQDITLVDSETLAYRKDGSTFPLHFRSTAIYHEGEFIGYQCHSRDVSELKKAEQRLRTTLSELELVASLIRHDFGNDLHVVATALDFALMVMESNTKSKGFVSLALSAAIRMKSLLSYLVPSYSEMEDGLSELVHNRVELAQKMHPDLKVDVRETESSKSMATDAWRLLPLVLDNLLRNSVTYAGPNCTVCVSTHVEDGILSIDVADDGPGIPSEISGELFQRGTTTSGSGFGLYLCRRIIEGYDGRIELLDSSPLNPGAAFRITLPVGAED
ncbi:MAG: PAS domain S-box protein [Candidatus Thorarchaeota archaeon]